MNFFKVNRLNFLPLLLLPTLLFSTNETKYFEDFPRNIDFGKFSTVWGQQGDKNAWILGHDAFNFAPELTQFFDLLKHDYNIKTVVETGTYNGATTTVFALHFDEVHTIEINEPTYNKSKANLNKFQNVHCHLGSSEEVLKQLLPKIQNNRTLFYLDAHWCNYWPLLDELRAIAETHQDNCVIVIDDFKVPDRSDIPFDKYQEKECSLEYIKDTLDEIYTSYDYYYLIPRSVNSRAKFVAIPKTFQN